MKLFLTLSSSSSSSCNSRCRLAWVVIVLVVAVATEHKSVYAQGGGSNNNNNNMEGMEMGGGGGMQHGNGNGGNVKQSDYSDYPPGGYCDATTTTTTNSSRPSCESPAKFVAPLPIPTLMDGTKVGSIHLTARKGCQQILHNSDGSDCGPRTEIWGFEGTMPGPTIVAQKGTPLEIQHANDLGQDYESSDISISVHHHGLHMLPAFDGHPQPDHVTDVSFGTDAAAMMYPGSSFAYPTTNQQEPGTFWYHDHAMHASGRNVVMGLAGFYLIQPNNDTVYDTVQNLPSGDYEICLAIQDRSFTTKNQFDYPMNLEELGATGFAHAGYFGHYMLVNGVHAPYLNVKGGWYRFRLLNGCNARSLELEIMDIKASSGSGSGSRLDNIMYQIGTEGGYISKPQPRSSIYMAPGERYDILVDFRSIEVGTRLYLTNSFVQEPELFDVMEFRIVSGSTPSFTIPTELVSYPWPSNPTVHRSFLLVPPKGNDDGWTIGDIQYDPNVANIHIQKGTTEQWSFQLSHHGGGGMMMMDPHPMHIHLVQFHVDGLNIGSLQDGWKDTVMVPVDAQVSITASFDGEQGVYTVHCHNLEHEDFDMMFQYVICDDSSSQTPCDPTLLNAFTATGELLSGGRFVSSAKESALFQIIFCLFGSTWLLAT